MMGELFFRISFSAPENLMNELNQAQQKYYPGLTQEEMLLELIRRGLETTAQLPSSPG